MHRKGKGEKKDFATELLKLGFNQVGDCTFFGTVVKIFRTNKTRSNELRYWLVKDNSTGKIFFKSNHCHEVLQFLRHSNLYLAGGTIKITRKERKE